MRISRLAFANIVIALVLLSTPFLIQLTASAPYDPWADLDDDGDIDIFDVVKIAAAYSTTGDPAKNVAVTPVKSRSEASSGITLTWIQDGQWLIP